MNNAKTKAQDFLARGLAVEKDDLTAALALAREVRASPIPVGASFASAMAIERLEGGLAEGASIGERLVAWVAYCLMVAALGRFAEVDRADCSISARNTNRHQ